MENEDLVYNFNSSTPPQQEILQNSGMGIASLVISIVSIFLCGFLSILSLIFGIIGINKPNTSKGCSIAGIVISSVGILISLITALYLFIGSFAFFSILNNYQNDSYSSNDIDSYYYEDNNEDSDDYNGYLGDYNSIDNDNPSTDFPTVFSINNMSINFPCTVSELQKAGYQIEANSINKEINPNENSDVFNMLSGNNSFSAIAFNGTSEIKKITDAKINYLSFESDNILSSSFSMSDKITWGSSYLEVFAIYGTPENEYYSEEFDSYTYSNSTATIAFVFENDKLSRVNINYVSNTY